MIKKHNVVEDNIDDNVEINSNYTNNVICELCGKKFLNISNLNKHLISNCYVKKSQIINNTNNITNNIDNSTNITNNINNINNNCQININNFGQEKVNQEKLIKLIQKTNIFNIDDLFMNYIIMKHVQTPENNNLFIKHRYGGQIYVFKGKWSKEEKDVTFDKIKTATIDDINDCINTHKHLNNAVLSGKLDKLEHTNTKKFNKNINDVLYKNKQTLEKSYEETKNYGK